MLSRERVVTALARREPDRVPYCELGIDRSLAQRLMGWGEPTSQAANLEANAYTIEEAKALAAELHLDNISYVLRAPVYTRKLPGKDGRLFYGEGLIRTRADIAMMDLPDPHKDELYAEAEHFARNKGDYAAFFVTRIGIFPTMLSMGTETFSVALYEDRAFVEEVLDIYCDWMVVVAERICQLDFDLFISTDDMAFNTAPFFSPRIFRELVLPRYRKIAPKITIPWAIHSDGNIVPFLDDLISVGVQALHPLEKNAVDPVAIKRQYGDRLCLMGNVDLNLLGAGTPKEVDAEVKRLIRDLAPGGGYIVTSGNSLAAYCLPENVRALSRAVRKYGKYPITL
ncbi:MAG: hypothetical protein H5T69_07330 [Chloroflexi bacterium]|nr:hypothetical protein [Chloroflexota bacterium]